MDLNWSPLILTIKKQIEKPDPLVLCFAPFIQLKALKNLVDEGLFTSDLKIITRWTAKDIIAQVSDYKIYPYLKSKNIKLYVNDRIHLKLLVFKSNLAFHASGNITNKGMGVGNDINVEIGSFVQTTQYDWNKMFEVIEGSILVDDVIYNKVSEYFEKNKDKRISPPTLEISSIRKKDFSISALPAFDNPMELFGVYSNDNFAAETSEDVRKCYHDIIKFNIPVDLEKNKFFEILRHNFIKQPFIVKIVEYIKKSSPLRFGAVNKWIHNNCSDVPLPYSWKIKENTHILYNWLMYFYKEINWNIPGKRSQVIYWKKQD